MRFVRRKEGKPAGNRIRNENKRKFKDKYLGR
jgi:hypothetical protein